MFGARATPRLRYTINVRDDRPPSKPAARRAQSNSAVASAAGLERRPGPVTPSTRAVLPGPLTAPCCSILCSPYEIAVVPASNSYCVGKILSTRLAFREGIQREV